MNGENKTMFSTPVQSLDKTIEQYNATRQRLNTEKGNQMTSQRFTNMENNLAVSINSNNEGIKKQGNIASRTGLVAQMILEEAAKHGKDYSTMTDGQILSTYKSKNPNRASIIDTFINSEQDPYELKKRMGWSNTPAAENNEPEKTFMDKAKTSIVGPFARAIGGLAEGIYGVGKGLANIPERANEFSQWQVDRGYINQMGPEGKNLDTNLYQKIKRFGRLAGTLGQMVGDVAGGALEGTLSGLSTNQEKAAVKDSVAEVAAAVINSEPGQKVQEMYDALSDEQKQELGDWFTVLDGLTDLPLAIGGGKVAKEAVKQGVKSLDNQVVKQGVKQLDNAIEGAETAIKNYKISDAIENLPKNTAKAEATAGRIVQGDIKAQGEAVNALKEIDTKGVKTYSELGKRIGSKKEEVAKKVDDILAQDKAKYDGKTSKQVDLGGGRYQTIGETPAQDAIDDLKALYEKIGDKAELVKIEDVERRLNTEGLSRLELNNLAKQHGNEFRRKAFNEDGSPKYSDIGTKFETNRSNLKEYVRELMPDDATKDLDRLYHNLADTDYYVNKMTEKVNHLTQTIKERNLFEKIGAKAGDILNTVSGGSIKSFVTKFIPSNVGNKVNNSIDMEKELSKMLKRLDTYQKRIDMANSDEAKEIIKEMENELKLD